MCQWSCCSAGVVFEREMSLRREERTASLRAGQTLEQQQDLDMEDAVALEQRNQELARLHELVCVQLFPVVQLLV